MQHGEKVSLLTAGRNLKTADGLEVGPRDAPLITRDAAHVRYVDYADAETIRSNLHDPAIDKQKVVDVDIVTGGGPLSSVMEGQVDYIVASHVAEHVPDLLGWLNDLHHVLRPGGTLGLAIPDRRFTFDRCRQESTIAEAVEAWLLASQRPSPRQIFDSAWQSFDISVDQGWRNEVPPEGALPSRQLRLRSALDLVCEVHTASRYNDAHCWVFTPASFLALMEQAFLMGLLPFKVDTFYPTEPHGYEFYVVLRRVESDDFVDVKSSIAAAQILLRESDGERAFEKAHELPEVEALRAQVEALQSSLEEMRARCLIPGFDGAVFTQAWKDALWARFSTAAPQRLRRSVERYSIVKRA